MSKTEERRFWRVMKDDYTLSGRHDDFGNAHNNAVEFASGKLPIPKYIAEDTQGEPVEVKETFEWFCIKCGDDYFTTEESQRPKGRWRCGACVYSWL